MEQNVFVLNVQLQIYRSVFLKGILLKSWTVFIEKESLQHSEAQTSISTKFENEKVTCSSAFPLGVSFECGQQII